MLSGGAVRVVILLVGVLAAGCISDVEDPTDDARIEPGNRAAPVPDPAEVDDEPSADNQTDQQQPPADGSGRTETSPSEPTPPAPPPTPLEPCVPIPIGPVVTGHQTLADGHFCTSEQIHVGPDATLLIRNATVRFNQEVVCHGDICFADLSVVIGATLTIMDSVLTTDRSGSDGRPGYWSVSASQGTLHIRNSTMVHIGGLTNSQGALSSSVVRDSVFMDGHAGFTFTHGASLVASDNVFYNMTFGVRTQDASAVIHDNLFMDVRYGVQILGSIVGEKQQPIHLEITNNTLLGPHQTGISLRDENGAIIRGNHIKDATLGMRIQPVLEVFDLEQTLPIVEDNTIESSSYAVNVTPLTQRHVPGAAATIRLHQMHFIDIECTSIHSRFAEGFELTIDARHNWWGSDAGPVDRSADCPAISGEATVLVDPWLREAEV